MGNNTAYQAAELKIAQERIEALKIIIREISEDRDEARDWARHLLSMIKFLHKDMEFSDPFEKWYDHIIEIMDRKLSHG